MEGGILVVLLYRLSVREISGAAAAVEYDAKKDISEYKVRYKLGITTWSS
jgi:hypothetical protein